MHLPLFSNKGQFMLYSKRKRITIRRTLARIDHVLTALWNPKILSCETPLFPSTVRLVTIRISKGDFLNPSVY